MKDKLFDLRMYLSMVKVTLRGMMRYRADFWTGLVGVFILNGANLAQMGVVTWRFTALGEWGMGDLMVLYGLYMVSWSIFSVFFRHVNALEDEIINGTFDKYLLRPVGAFAQFISGEISYTGFCDALLGAVLIATGKSMNAVVWSAGDIVWLIVFVVCGGITVTCIQLMVSCVSFWAVKARALSSMLTQIYLLTQKYPVSIFGELFRTLVTVILPIAFMNYYPAVLLLRKADAPIWLCMMSPVVTLALMGLSALVWSRGIRRYGSAGG